MGGKYFAASVVLRSIGGAFFFAALGGSLAMAVGSSASTGPSTGQGDFGFGVVLLYMVIAGFVVGGILGFVLVARLAAAGKFPGLTMTLAVLGYVVLWLGGIKSTQFLAQAREDADRARIQQAEHQEEINVQDRKLQAKASKELPALMGALLYPGAKSVYVDDPQYSRVTLSVTANLDKIDAYYKDLIFDRQRQPQSLKGKATRPGDGMALLMATEHFGRTSYNIIFFPASWSGGPSKWPADWRGSMPPPNATSYPDPSFAAPTSNRSPITDSPRTLDPARPPTPAETAMIAAQWQPTDQVPEIAATYGSLAYPGSRTNYESTEAPKGRAKTSLAALSTTDSMDKVVAYYRPLVQVSVDNFSQFIGITKRPDGVRTYVSVRREGEFTIISLSAS